SEQERQEFVSRMDHSVERLKSIATRALLLARATGEAQIPLAPEQVDPVALCKSVIDRMRPLVTSRQVSLELMTEGGSCTCWWDVSRVEYIVEELLVNAVRATPDGGSVLVRVGAGEDQVVIQVVDEGIGMTDAERLKVFEPFVTL